MLRPKHYAGSPKAKLLTIHDLPPRAARVPCKVSAAEFGPTSGRRRYHAMAALLLAPRVVDCLPLVDCYESEIEDALSRML